MTKVIEVIYENGVFKPLEKVNLPEKTRLKIKIEVERDIGHLRGKYGKRKNVDLLELRNEIHDRRNHIHR